MHVLSLHQPIQTAAAAATTQTQHRHKTAKAKRNQGKQQAAFCARSGLLLLPVSVPSNVLAQTCTAWRVRREGVSSCVGVCVCVFKFVIMCVRVSAGECGCVRVSLLVKYGLQPVPKEGVTHDTRVHHTRARHTRLRDW